MFLTVLTTVATFSLSPELLSSFAERRWGFVFPALAVPGLVLTGYFGFQRWDRAAFLSSGAYIVGMMASTAFAYGLAVGLVWWSIGPSTSFSSTVSFAAR